MAQHLWTFAPGIHSAWNVFLTCLTRKCSSFKTQHQVSPTPFFKTFRVGDCWDPSCSDAPWVYELCWLWFLEERHSSYAYVVWDKLRGLSPWWTLGDRKNDEGVSDVVWSQVTWMRYSCVTLSKALSFSVPHFPLCDVKIIMVILSQGYYEDWIKWNI